MPKSDTDKLAGAPALPFANDGSFMEQFLKMQSEQKASKSDKSSDRATEDDDFIASASFAGAKAGFIFKADKKGLGYYRDAPLGQSKSGATAKPNKPVILKSKPIINVQKRSSSGGELSASKKKKPEDGISDDNSKTFYQLEMERYRAKSCGADTNHERPLVK